MEFPVTITDKAEFKRMIRTIAQEAARETARALSSVKSSSEDKPMFLNKQRAYREAGSRLLVDRAVDSGALKVRKKEGKPGFLRHEFEAWMRSPR